MRNENHVRTILHEIEPSLALAHVREDHNNRRITMDEIQEAIKRYMAMTR